VGGNTEGGCETSSPAGAGAGRGAAHRASFAELIAAIF
jgi:hypothetical protein